MLKRLDRYLIAQFLGPIALGFALYTSLFLVRFLFLSAEMIIQRAVPGSMVLQLVWLNMPSIVVLTLPMSFLLGLLLALGRLASDSELTALRACGISPRRLYRPMVMLAIMATAANLALMVNYLPKANAALQELRTRALIETAGAQVEPRVFYDQWIGKTLFVFRTSGPHQPWGGVFLADSVLAGRANELTIAERGQLFQGKANDRISLRLFDATYHKVDPQAGDQYEMIRQRKLDRLVQEPASFGAKEPGKNSGRGVRELSLPELRELRRDPTATAEVRNLALVEIHKKFSFPFANLAFALLALPLGLGARRGGKASGFIVSLVIIALYYILISIGEEAARFDRLPAWLAMWTPNLLLAGAALGLPWYRDRRRPLPEFLRRVPAVLWRSARALDPKLWVRRALRRPSPIRSQRQKRRPSPAASNQRRLVLRFPSFALDFPTLIDRLVLKTFLRIFVLALLSGIVIFIVFDLSELFDEVLKNKIPASVLVDYYSSYSLRVVFDIAPMIFLVGTLLTIGLFVRSSELTAAKALGISIFRFTFPVVLCSLVIGVLLALAQSFLLPSTQLRLEDLKAQIKGEPRREHSAQQDRRWLASGERYIFNFSELGLMDGAFFVRDLQVFDFDQQHHLVRRLVTDVASYRDGQWFLTNGWVRTFNRVDIVRYRRFQGPIRVNFPETDAYFRADDRPSRAMSFRELREHIAQLKKQGQPVAALEVELQHRIAFPLLSLVMSGIALPFALRLGRQGALYGMGMALLLGIILLGFYAFFSKLGEAGRITPVLAVWSPAGIYSLLAGYLLLRVRS